MVSHDPEKIRTQEREYSNSGSSKRQFSMLVITNFSNASSENLVINESSCYLFTLNASAVECRSTPSIDIFDRPLIDTQLTPWLTLDQHLG